MREYKYKVLSKLSKLSRIYLKASSKYLSLIKVYIGLKFYELVLENPVTKRDIAELMSYTDFDPDFSNLLLEKCFTYPTYRELADAIADFEKIRRDSRGVPIVSQKRLPLQAAWTLVGFILDTRAAEKYYSLLESCRKVKGVSTLLNFLKTESDEAKFTEPEYLSSLSHYFYSYLLSTRISSKKLLLSNALENRLVIYYKYSKDMETVESAFSTVLSKHFIARVLELAHRSIKERITLAHRCLVAGDPLCPLKTPYMAVVYGSERRGFTNALWDIMRDLAETEKNLKRELPFIACHWKHLAVENDLSAFKGFMKAGDDLVYGFFRDFAKIGVTLVLSLPVLREQELHKQLSKLFSELDVVEVNPYVSSKIADSKYLTNVVLGKQNILVPKQVRLEKSANIEDSLSKIVSFAENTSSEKIVVKPEHGTEGLLVQVFNKDDLESIARHLERIFSRDSVVVEELRGNIGYSGYPTVFRLVVSWNGENFDIEGGYAIVSQIKDEYVASVSHGGKIVDINEALSRLKKYKGESIKSPAFLLAETAIEAAKALNAGLGERDYLKYVGLDLVLEEDSSKVHAVVIEANSRPSGLSYLRKLETGEASVIKNLLKYIIRILEEK